MNRALWLLIGLQTRGWVRSLGRNLRTAKGAVLALVGIAVLALWLWAVMQAPRSEATSIDPDNLRQHGPAVFLVYCLATVLISSGQRALYFTPAEVNFLFAGPFTRRQLIVYKITVHALIGLPTTLFLTLLLRIHARWDLAAYMGLYLTFLFLQTFTLTVHLIGIVVGGKAYTRSRKLLLIAVVAGAALAMAAASRDVGGIQGLIGQVEGSAIWKILAWPMRTFFETFLVESGDWSGLMRWSGLAALVVLAFLGLVLVLDAHYLETATTTSERLYTQLQKLRSGEAVTLHWRGSEKARWGLPSFPFWGGAGPIAWRQATAAIRSLGRLAILVLILGPIMIAPLFGTENRDSKGAMIFVFGMLTWLSMLLTTLVPFDFRSDLDRMEVLKTLPLPAWRIVSGQLLIPVLILWTLQVLCLLAFRLGMGLENWQVLVGITYGLPLNFLLFGLDNLLFLWFPNRMFATAAGDFQFQAVGRNVLTILAKTLVLLAALLAAGGLGALMHLVSGGNFATAGLTAWIVLTAFAITIVPVIGLAFQRFDVSRDLPA